jgi:hypothetical protein
MQVARGMDAAITGCIGRRRRTDRVRRRRDPGRPWCAQIRRPVQSHRHHDPGRRLLDRLTTRIRRRGRIRAMAAHGRRDLITNRRLNRRRIGLPIPIRLRVRIGLPARIGRQTKEPVLRRDRRLCRRNAVLLSK